MLDGFCNVEEDGDPPGKLHTQLVIFPFVEVEKSL
jgi:hypothetical protein